MAQGEYVSIVETDDYIEQDMLEVLYNEAKRSGADYVKGTSEGFFQCEGFEWRYVILPFEELKNNQRVEVNSKVQSKTFLEDNFLWNGIYSQGRTWLKNLIHNSKKVICLTDNNKELWTTKSDIFEGFCICSPIEAVCTARKENAIFLVTSIKYGSDIIEQLIELGVNKERVVTIS